MYRPSDAEIMHKEPTGPGRARRAVTAVAKAIGLGAVFTLATVGGVLLHMGLPAPRRFAAVRVTSLLESNFKGKVVVHRIGKIRLTELSGVDGEVFDPEGHRVVLLQGASARIGTLSLLRSMVSNAPLTVNIPELSIGWADVALEENEAGELSLARAFEPREPDTGEPSRGTNVTISDIRLGHVWAHGHMAAAPVIDADVDDVSGAFSSTEESMDIEVKRLSLRSRGLPGKDPVGTVSARASLPSGSDDKRRASFHYNGRVGAIEVVADGSLDGKSVVAIVDVPETTPEALAALAPGQIKLGAPVSAHAEVRGELPVLKPELRARVGKGEINASGTVTIPEEGRPDLVAAARISVKDIDVSVLQEGAPQSRLTAVVDAAVTSHLSGEIEGTFHLENQVGEVSGQVVPAASLHGELAPDRSVFVWGQVWERGAPTAVAASLQPRAAGQSPSVVDFEADTTVADFNAIERIGPLGRGRAHAVVRGKLDLDTKLASANATVELSGIAMKGVTLGSGFITAAAEGPIESPHFTTQVRGAGLGAAGYRFTSVRARASGTPQELEVSATLLGDEKSPHLAARAHITNRGDLVVRGADVRVEREDSAVTAKIASVRVAGGDVDIRGVEALGLGDPLNASARIVGSQVTVKAKSASIDLARVARLLDRKEDISGHLALDAEAAVRGSNINGRVEAQSLDLAMGGLSGATLRVSTTLEGGRLKGQVLAGMAETGHIEISAPEVQLGGPALDPGSWEKATGEVAIHGLVALDRALSLFSEEQRPIDSASGVVAIDGKAHRSSAADGALELTAATSGLVLVAKQPKTRNPDGSVTLGPTPWSTRGLDGGIAVKLNGQSGRTDVSAKVHDKHGALVSVDASANLPFAAMMNDSQGLLATMSNTPIEARVVVPRRDLEKMPSALGPMPVKGEVELSADLNGTLRAPQGKLTAKGMSLVPVRAADCIAPMDIETSVAYDGAKADVKLAAGRNGQEVLGADATMKVSAAQVIAGDAIAWEASGNVDFKKFPLDIVGAFIHRPIAGDVTGKVALKDLHREASLEGDLALEHLNFDRTAIPDGRVRVSMKDGALSASARLDQSDGYFEATAKGTMSWGDALAPNVDLAKAIEVEINAKNFRANAAAPFVQGAVTDLDGRIDADARLHIGQGGKDGSMDGAVTIRDGVLGVPQLGGKFHAMKGRLVMKPWGTVRFDDFSAEAPTGRLTASASAVFKGFALQNAAANVHIKDGESIPITVEGVPMGRASGDITATAKMSPDNKRLDLNVNIPKLHVTLPQSTGHVVQPLEPDETVRIGRHTGKEFALIALVPPEEPREPSQLAIHASITLGQDVEVRRDTTIYVMASGKTEIDITDKARVSGQIRLQRGRLEIQGKQFVIDRGVVSFVGNDPADPTIIATAYWDAPGSIRVYADFSGRVSSGKLNLRSEPALTQDEILALILFGSPDGSFGAESAPTQQQQSTGRMAGTKAAGMAGGVVTQGLNKAIQGITTADISTRVDTSEADSPRPELAVQLTKDISARLGYKLGVPAPGDNPDRTELTLEWRFVRNWSLVGVVGDHGSTALDVVWRLRY